jgi:hypothetical protein
VHCSIWRFTGDPDELERGYLALMADVPETNNVLHACAKTPGGLVMFDTCPSKEVFDAFFSRDEVRALFERHGLDLSSAQVEDYPVVAAFARRRRVDTRPWDDV